MSHTHYWSVRAHIPHGQWELIRSAAERACAMVPARIAWEFDQPNRLPEFSDECIRFNGVGDNGHETFLLERQPAEFRFCKTERKPYDALVVATLALAALHAPAHVEVSSSGFDRDWRDGLALAARANGEAVPSPLEGRFGRDVA